MSKLLDLFFVGLSFFASGVIALCSLPFFLYSHQVGQRFQYAFGRCWLHFMKIHRTVIGLENLPPNGGAILAPNHESMFDIPLISSLGYDIRWISKKEVGRIPFIGQAMRAMGCYFVSRDRSQKDLSVMSEVEEGLQKGQSVVIFPEGTRTRSGELLPFKKGAFRIAQKSGAKLVPIAITGAREIAEPGKPPTRGHQVIGRIGKPMVIDPKDTLPRAMEEFRERLVNLLSIDRGSAYNPSK